MQQHPETGTRAPPKPYVIDGERFYNMRQAASIIGTISHETLRAWAKRGTAPFAGFDLDVKRVPPIHDPYGFRHEAKTHMQCRRLIPEGKVFALKEILKYGPTRSYKGMLELEAAARRLRSPSLQHDR